MILVVAAPTPGCTARAKDVGRALQTPREAIPIPRAVHDIVLPPASTPAPFTLKDIGFIGSSTLAADGSADVEHPADSGRFVVTFSARNVPASSEQPLGLSDARPIVATLVANGIRQSDIVQTLQADPYQPAFPKRRPGIIDITFPIAHPSVARIGQLTRAIDAASGDPAFRASVSAIFALRDCAAPLGEARREALANGRTVARARAGQEREKLGALLEVREIFAGAARGQCGALPGNPIPLNIRVPPANPTDVIVRDHLTLTYATR